MSEPSQKHKTQTSTNRVNSAWGVVEYAAQAISLLLLTPLLLDRLGDSAFGILVIATTIMGLNGMFSLGLGPATQHFVAKYRKGSEINDEKQQQRLKLVVETSLIANAVFGVCTGALIVLFASALPSFFNNAPEDTSDLLISIIKIAGCGLPVIFIANTVDNTLRGFERFDLSVPLIAATRITTAAVQILLVLLGFGLIELVLVVVICKLLQASIGILVLKKSVLPELSLRASFSIVEFRKFVNFGVFAWLSSMFATARNSGEVLILAAILGPTVLTFYAIPSRILAQVHLLLAKAFAYLFPFVTKLIEGGDTDQVFEVYSTATRYLCTLSALAIPALAVGCGPLLTLWIGAERAELIRPVFQILAVRYAVFPLSILTTNLLMAANKTHVITIVMAINTLVILPASAAAAYFYGVQGAAMAQLLVFVPILFNRYYVEKHLFGQAGFNTFVLPVLLIAIPIVGALLMINVPVDYPLFSTAFVSAVVGLVCGAICWLGGNTITAQQVVHA